MDVVGCRPLEGIHRGHPGRGESWDSGWGGRRRHGLAPSCLRENRGGACGRCGEPDRETPPTRPPGAPPLRVWGGAGSPHSTGQGPRQNALGECFRRGTEEPSGAAASDCGPGGEERAPGSPGRDPEAGQPQAREARASCERRALEGHNRRQREKHRVAGESAQRTASPRQVSGAVPACWPEDVQGTAGVRRGFWARQDPPAALEREEGAPGVESACASSDKADTRGPRGRTRPVAKSTDRPSLVRPVTGGGGGLGGRPELQGPGRHSISAPEGRGGGTTDISIENK